MQRQQPPTKKERPHTEDLGEEQRHVADHIEPTPNCGASIAAQGKPFLASTLMIARTTQGRTDSRVRGFGDEVASDMARTRFLFVYFITGEWHSGRPGGEPPHRVPDKLGARLAPRAILRRTRLRVGASVPAAHHPS